MFVGWALDLITSLPETDEGEKYLIVAIDCYSKWVECGALTNRKSRTIAQWFYTNVLARNKCAPSAALIYTLHSVGLPRWVKEPTSVAAGLVVDMCAGILCKDTRLSTFDPVLY